MTDHAALRASALHTAARMAVLATRWRALNPPKPRMSLTPTSLRQPSVPAFEAGRDANRISAA